MSNFWRKGKSILIVLATTLSLVGGYCQGESLNLYQDSSTLKAAVIRAVEDHTRHQSYINLQTQVRSIDGRLRLKRCDEDLTASVTNPTQKLGRMTVEVRCENEPAWKIYVQATVTAEMLIPVLARPLHRGEVVTKSDIEFASIKMGRQSNPIADSLDYLVGMELRRNIRIGEPILLSALKAPEIVKRGQLVNIRYENNDLNIVVAGKAMQNGANGDWIAVENTSSGRQIEGRVNRDGSISIPGR